MKYLDLRTVFLFKKKLVGDSLSARCSFKSFVFLVVMMLMTTSNLFASEFIDDFGICYRLDPITKTATLHHALLRDGRDIDIVIPEKITDENGKTYRVVELEEKCFYNCSDLISVTIPPTVRSLGSRCFLDCYRLTSVTIPSSVTSIGDCCFMHCSRLTSVTLPPSLKYLNHACFQGCSDLISVTIPSSVKSLESSCFAGCVKLTSVTIPSSVTEIEQMCFAGCSDLISVTLPSSVTSLGDACFRKCRSLSSITLSSNIVSIGHDCFAECDRLPSITLPSTVESIGNQCFVNCNLLKTVKFYGKLPHFTKKEYEENYEIGLKKDCNIFVPEEYLQDYKNALGTDYMNIFAWNPTNINQEKVRGIMAFSHDGVVSITGLDSGEVVKFYTLDGKLVGSSVAADGAATCAVSETLVIAKFGNHAIKIAVK